jgi:branched-subunit amino acid aminotransferase/4-amino-4-deoxychorismate lyase
MKPFLLKNGNKVLYDLDSNVFISEFPRGAYTSARTVGTTSIFQFPEHVTRLNNSCKEMMKGHSIPKALTPLLDYGALGSLLKTELRVGIDAGSHQEYKITILLNWSFESETYDIFIHYSILTPVPQPPIFVEIIPGSRSHIKAKDSDWVRYRTHIESMKYNKKSNEIVLVDHDLHVYEGLSSNFFVVTKENKVVTAKEGVLYGTVMDLILQVCKEQDIEVIFEPPNLKDIGTWKEVFISSTTRLLLPITNLYLHDTKAYFDGVNFPTPEEMTSTVKEYTFSTNFCEDLMKSVTKKLQDHSTNIF